MTDVERVDIHVDIDRKASKQDEKPAKGRAYSSPKLRVFGPVGSLTQAGTGNAAEMAMGNNSRKML